MNKNEFERIQEKYFRDRFRLQAIKIGDLVWDNDSGGSYCPNVVRAVNVDEDYIEAIEISPDNTPKRMFGFFTESEMIGEGFTRETIQEEYKKYEGIIKKVMGLK